MLQIFLPKQYKLYNPFWRLYRRLYTNFTNCSGVSIVNPKQVNTGWEHFDQNWKSQCYQVGLEISICRKKKIYEFENFKYLSHFSSRFLSILFTCKFDFGHSFNVMPSTFWKRCGMVCTCLVSFSIALYITLTAIIL